ncbi:uncharacterized protein LOC118483990 [Helianthus annuus]|uniref:uncharacterized protein LOC118483990 n=1 Tax=Helianthus annuus TaxID=4232 RepID=UPI001652D522|nr:uncharacterized protein LOC118483990 [Helianthus annuus]
MNGSKDNSAHGGGRGAGGGGRGTGSGGGRGLRGGKRKQVAAGKRIDGDIVIDLSLNRDAGNIANGKRRFEMLDPKNPNKKVVVDPNHVWSHGRYLMIRNPDGKSSAFERAGAAGSSSQVGEGDEITMIQNTGGKTIAYKRVGAGSSSHAGEGDERADVSGMADATMPHVSRDNIDDDVFGEDSGDGQESDHGDGGDNDGVGDEGVGDEGVGDEGVGDDGVGDDGVGDEREFIQCDKNGFTNNKVSRSVKDILEQCYDGDWVTFKKVPQSARMRMFDRFRTKYRWRARAEQAIYDTFIDVLKSRFRVIMRNLREKSKQKAKDARREVPVKGYDIATLLAFPPDGFPLEKWQRMCEHWNTEKWQKKSEAGRSNRKNDLCLHTGGSIRFDQHRVNMDKENGKSVGYLKVFLQTHATKECKKMLKDGEITEKDYDQLKFVTEHAKRSYVSSFLSFIYNYSDTFTS